MLAYERRLLPLWWQRVVMFMLVEAGACDGKGAPSNLDASTYLDASARDAFSADSLEPSHSDAIVDANDPFDTFSDANTPGPTIKSCVELDGQGMGIAFRAGWGEDERLWYWPGAGRTPVQLGNWPVNGGEVGPDKTIAPPPRYKMWSADHTGRRLLFWERRSNVGVYQLLSVDIDTGCTTVFNVDAGPVAILPAQGRTYVVGGGIFHSSGAPYWEAQQIELVEVPSASFYSPPANLLNYAGAEYGLIQNKLFGPLSRRPPRIQIEGTTGLYTSARADRDGKYLCLVESGGAFPRGFIVDQERRSKPVASTPPSSCGWSPLGNSAIFPLASGETSLWVTQSGEITSTSPDSIFPNSTFEHAGKLWGFAAEAKQRRLIAFDWASPASTMLLSDLDDESETLKATPNCRFTGVEISGSAAVADVSCPCMDCVNAASIYINLTGLTTSVIEGPHRRGMYSRAFGPDGLLITASVPWIPTLAYPQQGFLRTDTSGTRVFEELGEWILPHAPVVIRSR
ncbi:MAG TPA: hypothetical protein VGF45_03295 [Polyangia bacterium]